MTEKTKKSNWKNLGGDLRVYVPSKSIYAVKSFRYLGIPNLFHCFGPVSEREARRMLPATLEAWKEKHTGAKEEEKTVEDVIPLFLKYETPKKRARTQVNHRQIFADIGRFFGDLKLSELDEDVYADRLIEARAEKARMANERRIAGRGGAERKTFDYLAVYLNALLRFAYKRKLVSHLAKIPFTDDTPAETGRALDIEAARRLFGFMGEDAKDMYALSYGACMRKNEGLLLTWDRVDLETGAITLRAEDVKTGSRTKRGRTFMVTDWIRLRLVARFERQKGLGSPWVFPSPIDPSKPQKSIRTAWTAAKRRAGITGRLRWHDLRHSALTHLVYIHKQSLADISRFAGVSIRTLERVYLHSRPEQTRPVGEAIGRGWGDDAKS